MSGKKFLSRENQYTISYEPRDLFKLGYELGKLGLHAYISDQSYFRGDEQGRVTRRQDINRIKIYAWSDDFVKFVKTMKEQHNIEVEILKVAYFEVTDPEYAYTCKVCGTHKNLEEVDKEFYVCGGCIEL